MLDLPQAVAAAAAQPSPRSWREICAWIARLPEGASAPWIEAIDGATGAWPTQLRTAPWIWVDRIVCGHDAPGWSLVRNLDLTRWGRHRPPVYLHSLSHLLGSPEHMAGIEWLDLTDNGIDDADVIAALAACAPPRLERLSLSGNPVGRIALAGLRDTYFPRLRRLRLARAGLDPANVARLADRLELPLLARLDLSGNDVGDVGASALATSERLTELRVLTLATALIGDAGAAALAESETLGALVRLDLRNNEIGPLGAAALGAGTGAPRLTDLFLADNPLGPTGLEALADGPLLGGLQGLDIARTGTTSGPGLEALAGSSLRGLRRLDLSGNDLGREAALVAESPYARDLRDLRLAETDLHYDGFARIAAAQGLRSLVSLDLHGNRPGPRGITALVTSRSLTGLQELDLADCALDARSVRRISGSPLFQTLRALSLASNRLWGDGATQLALRPAKLLRRLNLAHCAVGPDGLATLLTAAWMDALTDLDLSGNGLNDAAILTLANSPATRSLSRLALGDHFGLTDVAAEALARSGSLRRLGELDLQGTRVTGTGAEALIRSMGMVNLARVDLSLEEVANLDSQDPLRSLILRGTTKRDRTTPVELSGPSTH